MRNEHQKEFIDQRLYYKNDFQCKVNLRIHKPFVKSVLCKNGEENINSNKEIVPYLQKKHFQDFIMKWT